MSVIRSSRPSMGARRRRAITEGPDGPARPGRRSRGRSLAGPAGLDLLEGLLHEALGVGRGHVAAQDLGGDRDRQVDRLLADPLDRARGLLLDLALGVLDDRLGVGARLLLELLAE